MRYFLFSILSLFMFTALSQTVTYTASNEDFVNPDRGFYTPIHTHASNFVPLSLSDLVSKRITYFTPWQGNYQVRTTLVFRHYVLDAFVNTDTLSQSFLTNVQNDMNTARQAGIRLILRFSYTTTPNTSCGTSACPPYGDAPKLRVLTHIDQLKYVLQNNPDVISTVQMGFIGTWGENYYTDYFGDPSPNGDGRIFNAKWQDRIDVLDSLLQAVPNSRMIQVRYPQMKQKYVYGITAPVTAAPLTSNEAHTSTDKARVSFHNDCFLAAPDDFGTYWDYGSDTSFPSDQTAILKPYSGSDGQYGAVGGETCFDAFSPQNDCTGQAIEDMEQLHYSFLNSDYNNDVNNDWQTGGCMDSIKRRLGYRFEMINLSITDSVEAGNSVVFVLNAKNNGFAAPFNEWKLQLILKDTINQITFPLDVSGLNTDARFWQTGAFTVQGNATLPTTLPVGAYQLYLHIFDDANGGAVANRPEYSIRFANQNVWEATTGYNKLLHTLHVKSRTTSYKANKSINIANSLHVSCLPNPFSSNTQVQLELSKSGLYSIQLYNQIGRLHKTLMEKKYLSPGRHSFFIEGLDFPSGVYLLRIEGLGERSFIRLVKID